MSNWKAGDKAVCVQQFEGRIQFPGHTEPTSDEMPVLGVTYLVDGVGFEHGVLALHLAGLRYDRENTNGYLASKFRKVITASEADEIFIAELKAMVAEGKA